MSEKPGVSRSGDVADSRVAVFGNALIEAHYRMSAPRQAIIAILIAQLKPIGEEGDRELPPITFNTVELADALNSGYDTIREKRKFVYDVVLKLHEQAIGLPRDAKHEGAWVANWVQPTHFSAELEEVTFRFTEELRPYLLGIRNSYTKVIVESISKMTRWASPRLYLLLKQYEGMAKDGSWERRFKLPELRSLFALQPDEYVLFGHLNDRLVAPAVSDVNKFTDLTVGKPIKVKEGKKVIGVNFKVALKKNHQVEPPKLIKPLEKSVQDKMEERFSRLEALLLVAPAEVRASFDQAIARRKEEAANDMWLSMLPEEDKMAQIRNDVFMAFAAQLEGSNNEPRQ